MQDRRVIKWQSTTLYWEFIPIDPVNWDTNKGYEKVNKTYWYHSYPEKHKCSDVAKIALKPCGWWQHGDPSGPTSVVILVVEYISELTIHSVYFTPSCVKEIVL